LLTYVTRQHSGTPNLPEPLWPRMKNIFWLFKLGVHKLSRKFMSYIKSPGASTVTRCSFHTEGPKILRTTVQIPVATRPGDQNLWNPAFNQKSPHPVIKIDVTQRSPPFYVRDPTGATGMWPATLRCKRQQSLIFIVSELTLTPFLEHYITLPLLKKYWILMLVVKSNI
jgi:hypothetical protein